MKGYREDIYVQRLFSHLKYFKKFSESNEQSKITKGVRTPIILFKNNDWDDRYHKKAWICLSNEESTKK